MRPVDADMVLVAEHRDGQIDRLEGLGAAPSLTLALVYLTLQRASRSFCRIFAGLSCQRLGTRPS
jgi:hypothetical protein